MEVSTLLNNTNKISKSVCIGENYIEKTSEKLYCNEISLCVDPIVQVQVGEAKDRLKKLEQDYQRTYKKYKEAQLNMHRCYIEGKSLKYHSRWGGHCIDSCKNLVKQLHRLNVEGASQRKTVTHNHGKKFLMLHGCISLAQEKMILKQKAEHKQPNIDKLSKKAIDFKAINLKFCRIQRDVPRISRKKHVHDLLSNLKETNKVREKATIGGSMVDNPTSQDNIRSSTNILLQNVIKELEKEKRKTDDILGDKRKVEEGYTEKMRHLQEKKEWICGKWDDERKYMLGLKHIHDESEYFLPPSERWIRDTVLLPYFFLM